MTVEGVDYNLSRLEYFLGAKAPLPREIPGMASIDVLLEGYSRIMDYNGCGREQLTRLFFIQNDYDALNKYVRNLEGYKKMENAYGMCIPGKNPHIIPGHITFQLHTYVWWASRIDEYQPIKAQP